MSRQYGCGATLHLPHLVAGKFSHTEQATCGEYFLGYMVQCDSCQESKPVPFQDTADPNDEDAQAERAAELERNGRSS